MHFILSRKSIAQVSEIEAAISHNDTLPSNTSLNFFAGNIFENTDENLRC